MLEQQQKSVLTHLHVDWDIMVIEQVSPACCHSPILSPEVVCDHHFGVLRVMVRLKEKERSILGSQCCICRFCRRLGRFVLPEFCPSSSYSS